MAEKLNLQETMRESSKHIYGFDSQVDFSKFLEEARNYASTREANHVHGTNSYSEAKKKIKKSWKASLLSWLRIEKKKSTGDFHVTKPRKGHASGPIYGTSSSKIVDARLRRHTSGPVTNSLLNLNRTRKKAEDEMTYMCLDQMNSPHHLKSYGPVYLVT